MVSTLDTTPPTVATMALHFRKRRRGTSTEDVYEQLKEALMRERITPCLHVMGIAPGRPKTPR
jgi:hypothetical protein